MPEQAIDVGDLVHEDPPELVETDDDPDVLDPPDDWDAGAHADAHDQDPAVTIEDEGDA